MTLHEFIFSGKELDHEEAGLLFKIIHDNWYPEGIPTYLIRCFNYKTIFRCIKNKKERIPENLQTLFDRLINKLDIYNKES